MTKWYKLVQVMPAGMWLAACSCADAGPRMACSKSAALPAQQQLHACISLTAGKHECNHPVY
jgi:hypothetical protein